MSVWWASLGERFADKLRQWDRRWARETEQRFSIDRARRRGTTGRILKVDTAGVERMTRPHERPLFIHHVGLGSLDGLVALGDPAQRLSDVADMVVVAWRGDGEVDDLEKILYASLGAVGGRWRVLLHVGADAHLVPALGPAPPPGRSVLLDVDGGILRSWDGTPDARRVQVAADLAAEALA